MSSCTRTCLLRAVLLLLRIGRTPDCRFHEESESLGFPLHLQEELFQCICQMRQSANCSCANWICQIPPGLPKAAGIAKVRYSTSGNSLTLIPCLRTFRSGTLAAPTLRRIRSGASNPMEIRRNLRIPVQLAAIGENSDHTVVGTHSRFQSKADHTPKAKR